MKNVKAIFALLCLVAFVNSANSQTVGISADPANTANSKAILDLDGVFGTDYRGMLLPRMTDAQKVTYGGTLVAGDEGMTIFNTTNDRYEFWNGTSWVILATTANVSSSTLDDAYDAGGSGLGRTITADNGAVEILGNDGLYVNGDVQVNSLAGTGNRPVHVDANGVLQTNSAITRIDPLYIRGTGLNHNSNRVLKLGSTEVYNAGGRGLRLTIIEKTNHAVLSDVLYDTYGSAAAASNLATALNGVGNSDIGILTSYDAWEGQVNAALRTAFQRLGLYKALMTVGGSRKPYAAIFEGSSNTSVPSVSVVEVEHSDNGSQPYSEIRGWLIDGAFVAASQVPSALSTPVGAFAVGVNESGNVGIGITAPAEELHVIGDIRSSALAGGGNVQADANGNLIVSNDIPNNDPGYIHNQNALDQAASFRINGWGETYGLKINAPDGEKIQFTNAGPNGSKIRHTTGWALDYHSGPGNSSTTGSHRFYTTASNTYRERMGIESTGRVNIRQDIGNDPAFTGLESPESAFGRAQLVLSSSYSDLVIASRESNNNHGSTVTFATYNPSNAGDYRKFVINQGNWGSRAGFLDFGFSNAGGRANPHLNINATDNVVTMDGYNKRVGIGNMNPGQALDVSGNIRSTGGHYINYNNPTIYFQDTDHETGMIHMNSHLMYFLSGSGNNSTNWTLNGSQWPLTINMTNDVSTFGGPAYFMEGSVGINTTSPSGLFHVNNTDDSYMYYSTTGNLYLQSPESSTAQVRIGAAWNRPGVYSNQQLELFSDATGIIFGDSNVELMRMEAGGDFGVGTNNPIYRIHSAGDIYADGGWMRVSGNNGLYFESHGTGIHSVLADGGQYGSVNSYGSTGGWEGYAIDSRYVFMGQDNGQEWGIYNDVDNIWAILYNRLATDNGFRFFNSWSGALNMRIQHTNGGNYASYDGDSNWDFYSDRRLKEDIENEENILERLLKMDVVNYNFIDQGRTETEQKKGIIEYARKEKEIGFIAQEVEKYFPSLVSESEDDRFDFKVKALGYSSFGVLAIGGIKELKIEKDKEIAALKKQIEGLQTGSLESTEVQELKAEVDELKELVKALMENQK